MNEREVFTLDQLAAQANIEPNRITELEALGLLGPSGRTATHLPYYESEKISELAQVLRLLEMGYEASEVRKIRKKVGIPGGRKGKKNRTAGFMTVGELAEKTQVGTRTLKHWEDKGIIEPNTRSEGGFRLYNRNYVYFVELIKDLQLFGYKLEEIKSIGDLFRLYMDLKNGINQEPAEANLAHMEAINEKTKEFLDKTRMMKQGIRRWEKLLEENRKEINRVKDRYRRAASDPTPQPMEPAHSKGSS